VHKALQDAGFKVQPLVGDKSGGWNMSWYRETFKDPAFAAKAVEEIKAGKLEGLNFDYEPHQPGNLEDAVAYAAMVDGVAAASGSQTTMDFPCDGDLCDVASLTQNPKGGKLLDMSTYGAGMLYRGGGGAGGPPAAPLASRFHRIHIQFSLNLHGV
jgi:hypothetical protein